MRLIGTRLKTWLKPAAGHDRSDHPANRFRFQIRRAGVSRFCRNSFAIVLSLLLTFSPLSPLMVSKTLAPVSVARADAKDDLKKCLDIAKTAVNAAKSIADAVADPTYLACTAQMAALNPVAIGMAAAVTGFYAMFPNSFDNPEECNGLIAKTMLGFIADTLADALTDTEGLLYKLLDSIIGSDGIQLIKDVAGYFGIDFDAEINAAKDETQKQAAIEAKKAFDDLIKTLTTALGPVMMQLQCGCAVAGTVAIIQDAAAGVADAGDACLSILTNPGALLSAFLDDPLGVLGTVGKAVCDGVAEVADVCGAAEAFYNFASGIVDAACSVPGVCDTVGAVVDTVVCWFSDCDDPPPPPVPPQCEPDVWMGASLGNYCICSPPMGKVGSSKQFKYTDYNEFQAGTYAVKEETVQGITCRECGEGSGLNDKGFCEKCVLGFSSKNADGSPTAGYKCTANYFCGSNEHYKADNTGCYSCPEGQKFDPTNTGCWPVCESQLVNDKKSGQCVCPPTADGKAQYLVGPNFDTCGVVVDCDASFNSPTYINSTTNTCELRCPDPRQYFGTTDSDATEVKSFKCMWCPDGQFAVDNKCTDFSGFGAFVKCGDNEIHGAGGNCTKCEAGTEKGEGNNCVPVCPDGSEFNPDFKKGLMGVSGDWRGSMDKLLAGQNISAASNSAAINQAKGFASGSSSAPAGPSLPPYCTRCGENEQSLTLTMSGKGYSKTERVCVKCPEGQVSKPGGRCYNPTVFQTTSLTPQMPPPNSGSVVRPTVPGNLKAKTYTPEELGKPATGGLQQKPKGKNTGTAALPKGDPPTKLEGTPVLPKQAKPTCPPGQVSEGGRCYYPRTTSPTPQAPQLNMPSMGGGSSAPGFAAPSAAPSGPTGTAVLPRQPGGVTGTPVLPRQPSGGFQGNTIRPNSGFDGGPSSGNTKPF